MRWRYFSHGARFQMKILITFILSGLCSVASNAQTGSPAEGSAPAPTATPIVFSPQTLVELKRLEQAALGSDYAYRQVAHLADNIGPRLSGSAQAGRAVEY